MTPLFADGVNDLAKVIADNWPWFLGSVLTILGSVIELLRRGAIWTGTRIVLPLKEKAITTVDAFQTKHFALVDNLETQLQRQTEAAEQSVTVLKRISDGAEATNQRVEQIADITAQNHAILVGGQPKLDSPNGPEIVGIARV